MLIFLVSNVHLNPEESNIKMLSFIFLSFSNKLIQKNKKLNVLFAGRASVLQRWWKFSVCGCGDEFVCQRSVSAFSYEEPSCKKCPLEYRRILGWSGTW